MTRWQRFFLLVMALLLLSLCLVACGGDEAEPAAEAPPAQADTPVPPTETPRPPTPQPPTATPVVEPTPTPRLIDPATLTVPQDLDTFILTQFESWEGTGLDGAALAFQTDIVAEFVRDPEALYVAAVSDDPEAAEALQLMASEDGSIEIYFVGGHLYTAIMGGWMQIPVDVPASMIQVDDVPFNPTSLMEEAFAEFTTVIQWLDSAVYQGQDTVDGMAVERYAFDASSFNPDRLPPGMVIEQADGQFYLAREEGYLVGLELSLSGSDLVLAADEDQATLSEGTVVYRFGLSAINKPLTVQLPEEALRTTRLPDDIPVPADALQAGVFNMMGFQSFSYLTESPVDEVAAFYRDAMPENGWTEAGATDGDGSYSLTYTKDDRQLEISIVADSQPGYTGIDLMPSAAG